MRTKRDDYGDSLSWLVFGLLGRRGMLDVLMVAFLRCKWWWTGSSFSGVSGGGMRDVLMVAFLQCKWWWTGLSFCSIWALVLPMFMGFSMVARGGP